MGPNLKWASTVSAILASALILVHPRQSYAADILTLECEYDQPDELTKAGLHRLVEIDFPNSRVHQYMADNAGGPGYYPNGQPVGPGAYFPAQISNLSIAWTDKEKFATFEYTLDRYTADLKLEIDGGDVHQTQHQACVPWKQPTQIIKP